MATIYRGIPLIQTLKLKISMNEKVMCILSICKPSKKYELTSLTKFIYIATYATSGIRDSPKKRVGKVHSTNPFLMAVLQH